MWWGSDHDFTLFNGKALWAIVHCYAKNSRALNSDQFRHCCRHAKRYGSIRLEYLKVLLSITLNVERSAISAGA